MTDYSIECVSEIEKDLKHIHVDGFDDDFERFKKALPEMLREKEHYHFHGLYQMPSLGKIAGVVYKAKKIRCQSLHSKDKFRVIFQVIGDRIIIIEVYFKGQKENEDKQRILAYCQESN